MNDQTIQMIAQAIIANTKVIQSLIDSLPKEAVQAVAQAANVTAPAPVQQVVQAAPIAAPVAPTPVAAPVPVTPAAVQMPAAPFPVTPAPVAAPVVAAPVVPVVQAVQAPFNDTNGLIQYIMGAYQAMGPTKGAHIQGILGKLGYQRVNDVQPQHYGDLFQAVEALKAA